MITFNINEAAQRVFGIPTPFSVTDAVDAAVAAYTVLPIYPEAIIKRPITNDDVNRAANIYRATQTGVPMFDWIQLKLPRAKGDNSHGALDEFIFPDSTIMHLQKAKRSVITPLAGRDGAVVEIVGNDFYRIRMYGFIINGQRVAGNYIENNAFPLEKMQAMENLVSINEAMPIFSEIANALGVFHVTPQYIDFPPMPGFANVQPFEIHFVQDEPIQLIMTN
jgi:hypothetical protein